MYRNDYNSILIKLIAIQFANEPKDLHWPFMRKRLI